MSGMDRWKGRVALVTGASQGIGKGIATALVKAGMVVWGCARNVDKIKAYAAELKQFSGSLHAIRCDVGKEADILAMFDEIKKQHGGVDVLVNNAGMMSVQTLLQGETEEWRKLLEINVLAVAICTREAVKSMQERGVDDGHIIHMLSTGLKTHTRNPAFSMSLATKCAVAALLEGHRLELSKLESNIKVSALTPGMVLSAGLDNTSEEAKYFENMPHLQVETICDAAIYILSCPPNVQVHDLVVRHPKDYAEFIE